MRCLFFLCVACALVAPALTVQTTAAAPVVVVTPDQTINLPGAIADGDELWVTPDDLTKATSFVLKPEGACSGELCVPISREPAAGFIRSKDGQTYFNLTKLAAKLNQPVAAEADPPVYSLGEIPALRAALAAGAIAPDFALLDRAGKTVHLSDFRGKKIFLFTWASWCGCKLDLPGWQTLYTELKDKNFEIIAVAEDTAGEKAAGPSYDRAKATYTTLLDPDHVVSSLYHMVNVPTGVWIDEQGHLVRPPEVAYSRNVALMNIKVAGDKYVAALRDWVEKGAQSQYAMQPAALREALSPRPAAEALADAHFKLGTYFQAHQRTDLATKHWQEAQKLNPDSWNYHRQEWSYTPSDALNNWMAKVRQLGDKPYYAPLKLEGDQN